MTIKNCFFRDLSGDAINYAAEKDDIGRYNADDMLIENCSFYRLLGLPIIFIVEEVMKVRLALISLSDIVISQTVVTKSVEA